MASRAVIRPRSLIPLLLALAGIALILLPSPGRASADRPMLAAAGGLVTLDGETVFVEVVAVAPPGESAHTAARAALRRIHPQVHELTEEEIESGYVLNGMRWQSNPVAVNFNDAGAAVSGGRTALLGAMQAWTDAPGSDFAFVYGADTTRCPSLVAECPGDQVFDGNNDIGWLDIANSGVLGVTWVSVGRQEFDIAIDNRNFAWATGCAANVDLQTVMTHELGHALGLGHSSLAQAVMYYQYGGVRCGLHSDDIAGLQALYPSTAGTVPATSTPTATNTATPVPPTGTATPTNTAMPPTATATNTPVPTATATATPTNTPTAEPTPTRPLDTTEPQTGGGNGNGKKAGNKDGGDTPGGSSGGRCSPGAQRKGEC